MFGWKCTSYIAAFGCALFFADAQAETRIVIAGDSTASDYPVERAPQTGWGQALPYYMSGEVLNLAVSGRSTKSYIDEGKWTALLDKVQPGDVVLISFGHNDSRDDAPERYTAPEGAFRDNLKRFASDVQARQATALILSPAARRLWEGPAMVETHGLYAHYAQKAASESGAGFIDLSNLSLAYFEALGRNETKDDFLWLTPEDKVARFPDGVEDNTHFTALGACGVARVIAMALAQMPGAAGFVDSEKWSGDDAPQKGSRPASVHLCEAVALDR